MYLNKTFPGPVRRCFSCCNTQSVTPSLACPPSSFPRRSRNIVLSIKTLCTRVGADRAAYVRALVVANQAMQTRSALQAQAQAWMDEAGGTPPLNGVDAGLLGDSGSGDAAALDTAAMSAAELAAYEEQKLKMRRAMGEGRDSQDAAPVGDERRLRMIAAVEVGRRRLEGHVSWRLIAKAAG